MLLEGIKYLLRVFNGFNNIFMALPSLHFVHQSVVDYSQVLFHKFFKFFVDLLLLQKERGRLSLKDQIMRRNGFWVDEVFRGAEHVEIFSVFVGNLGQYHEVKG